ncbi:hypothetical protein [Streptomyces sp. NRRL S-378]|uniref:hypothetical protein n=1 Tax=Streptomyces sp. NRRL S-378 TaxID=1463904 RepID=UPI001F329D6B|nr:hypothetical protein [Streptomyces sp. NRRL S-378]
MSAIPAHAAEGQFESYMKWWTAPQESRRWHDSNSTSDYTGIYFQGCTADSDLGFAWAELKLYIDRPSLPDKGKGTETNRCGWVDYGDPDEAGNYYFQLSGLANGEFINIDYVKVAW